MEGRPTKNIPEEAFQLVVNQAPLVSVDLVIIDPLNYCLLGRRKNRPAKGSMFVPGGRILKNEAIGTAVNRILLEETGYKIRRLDKLCFIGVYEHFYTDSYWDDKTSTHYVVLAYRINLKSRFIEEPDKQHDILEWLSLEELLTRSDVHKNVKTYFI